MEPTVDDAGSEAPGSEAPGSEAPGSEAPGSDDAGGAGERLRPAFVLHEHRVPRHHWDLRLEEGGVLRSWALPRGLPADSRHDRLAVAVPDHGLEHLGYQDADKAVADTGWWQEEDRTDRRLLFRLHGRRGVRRYALVRTDRDWLLHLTKDQPGA